MKDFILQIMLGLLLSGMAQASTFVGNGGNAGDVELAVTRREIQETLNLIAEEPASMTPGLCICASDLRGHAVCDILDALSEPQRRMCQGFLKDNAIQLDQAFQSAIVTWSFDNIQVQEGKGYRAVDAVTRFDQKTIVVSQNRFLAQNDYERMFLLTHEAGHLLTYEGAPIDDVSAFGAFAGAGGGRQFLNAIAAGVVSTAYSNRILQKYQAPLRRSRGYKNIWIELGANSSKFSSDDLFAVTEKKGSAFSLRYHFENDLGLQASVRSGKGQEDILSTTKATENTTGFLLGATYRYFPFRDPLSYFGQSHMVFMVGAEHLNGKYKLEDPFIETSQSASSTAVAADFSYFLPIQGGFWIYGRLGYRGHNYKYELPYRTVEMKAFGTSEIGVSYGF